MVKKDYFDSKLMLHWSYICTFAGCLVGGMSLLGGAIILLVQSAGFAEANVKQYH